MKNIIILCALLGLSLGLQAQTVYITKTGDRYHRSTCHHIRKSGKAIKLSEAKTLNYTPCRVCRPRGGSGNNIRRSNNYNGYQKSSGSHSRQCSGTTKSGRRCKRMTKSSNGRCYQH